MTINHFFKPISDKERAKRCFKGELIIYKNVPAMHELITYADDLLSDAFTGIEPIEAQHHFWPEEFLQRSGNVQKVFRTNEQPKQLFFKALEQCGVDLANTYYDHFPMRIVPFGSDYNGGKNSLIGHHRDTWGSNVHSQINWWAPIYELEAERTIAIYPDYWNKAIANTTAIWSFDSYIEKQKEAKPGHKGSYPSAPTAEENVDESGVIKVILETGDILNFSSAHLHASVPNTTEIPRFSVEMRTVNIQDVEANRKAHNVDNEAKKPMYQWFKNIKTKDDLSI